MKQIIDRQSFVIPGAEQWNMTSRHGNTYRIMLWRPDSPAPDEGYPVIYMLDANACFGAMAEAVRMHARGPHRLEAAVVVGIGYDTDQPFDTDRRFYDYTIPAYKDELPERKIAAPWPKSGGAEQFLNFIENEVKPIIEQELPINRRRQTLFGHSLGGWFALYTMFTHRQSFQFYAAGSPSIWWKNNYIVPVAERIVRSWKAGEQLGQQVGLLLGVGGLEKPTMVDGAKELYELVSQAGIPDLQVEHYCFAGENHLSVIFPFIVRTVRFILSEITNEE